MNSTNNPTIAVIDDEEIIRYTLQKKLARLGYNIVSLERAEEVLYLLRNGENPIDLIITDIKLRKMDGIELLRHIGALENPIPVLIVTGQGNIEDAIKALRYGACDFIRKPFDMNEVASSVRGIIRTRQEKQLADAFGQYIDYEKRLFTIPMDISLINVISYKLTKNLPSAGLCNKTTAENLSLALREAMTNAMFHGNMEIPSDVRAEKGVKGFNEEIENRRALDKYKDRKVSIHYELTKDFVEYTIEDEGRGFNYRSLPDPRDPENFLKNSGRGLLIIRIHADEVDWNASGNCIRIRKYRINRNNSNHVAAAENTINIPEK
jgi:DNA-binding response OmpR family regulator